MAELLTVVRPAGLPLKLAGGLPRPVGPFPVEAAKRVSFQKGPTIPPKLDLVPSLQSALRPQAAARWQLPSVAAMVPQYVESVLRGALYGNHVQAWQLYDLMWDTDAEIASCIGEYVDDVMNKKFIFEPYRLDEEEPSSTALEKCQLIKAAFDAMRPDMASDENDLKGTVKDLLAARFHGTSFLAIDWFDTFGTGQLYQKELPGIDTPVIIPRATYWVHPMCYALDMAGRWGLTVARQDVQSTTTKLKPNNKFGGPAVLGTEPASWSQLVRQPRPDALADFPKDQFLLGVFKAKTGTVLGASCLRPLALWWVASNFCFDWLLNYAQLFGIPMRTATYAPTTPEAEKAEIRQMLQSMGSCGWALLPEGTVINFDRATAAGESPQSFLYHLADSQKRKVILHQTMTGGAHDSMGKGGGKAFGQVETDTKADCIMAGASWACSVINQQFIPNILVKNYGEDGDLEAPTVKLVDAEVGGLADAQRDQVLVTFVDVPTSYLRRKYGIPKPSDDDDIAGQDEGTVAAQADAAAKAQKAQVDVAKANAAAPKPPKPGDSEQTKEGADAETDDEKVDDNASKAEEDKAKAGDKNDGTGTQARSASVEARDAVTPLPALSKAAAEVLHDTVQPMLDRIQAIADVPDTETRVAMLKKFLKDAPHIAAALVHDDSLAKQITPELVSGMLKGMKKEPKNG